jgi:hypothetical protein
MARGEAFNEKAKSQRRVSAVIRELLESTNPSPGIGELIGDFVGRRVSL